MKEARPQDTYKTLKESAVSFQDDSYLLDLYVPIISLKVASIYLALRNEEAEVEKNFSDFYLRYQVSEGEMSSALDSLEAIGLIKTFVFEKTSSTSFVFAIYSPRSPQEFLSNELLHGTLLRYSNDKYLSFIKNKYTFSNVPEGYKDISKKFMDQFQLDLNGNLYHSSSKNLASRRSPAISLYFDRNKFINKVKDEYPSFNESSLSKAEFVKIARYAALYSFDEETIASFLISSASVLNLSKEYGDRVNFRSLEKMCIDNDKHEYMHRNIGKKSEVSGNSGIAIVVRAMDNLSSVDFLKRLQNGGKPAQSDLKLINTLVVEMGLPENVTNALIFYVLKIKNNVLSATYVEKLAGSLVREGCLTALDALNYLENTSSKMKPNSKKVQPKKEEEKPLPIKQEEMPKSQKAEEEDDYEAILDSL